MTAIPTIPIVNTSLIRVSNITLGHHKGTRRVYLQGKYLNKAGFNPSTPISIDYQPNKITVTMDQNGNCKVCSKKAGEIPVIDIVNKSLEDCLTVENLEIVTRLGSIVITPSKTEKAINRRVADKTCASIFAGGGLLSWAGKMCGYNEVYAIEKDEKFSNCYSENFPQSTVYHQEIHEVDFASLPQVDLLLLGIPCEPFAKSRRSGKGYDKNAPFEAHELGDMVYWALRAIEASNPKSVIIEQGPDFLNSGAGHIVQHALKRMGYNLDCRVMNSADYGYIMNRNRSVIVATTDSYNAPHESWCLQSMADIISSEKHDWFDRDTKSWLYEHWDKQTKKGNNFAHNLMLTKDSSKVPSIKKRYFAQQGDNPVVTHESGEKHRWFTLTEVKTLFGLPEEFKMPTAKTTAGEIIGQGVVVGLFTQIINGIN